MKKLKLLSAVSILAIAISVTPVVSFAKENGHGVQPKIEAHASVKANGKSNSIFARLAGFFAPSAQAATVSAKLNPNIAGVKAPTVLKTGETGTWTVKASDPQNGSLEYAVDWGENSGMTMNMMALPAFLQTSTFTHAYANPGTYTVKFTVKNDAGSQTSSSVTVHVTGAPVQNAPVISGLSAQSAKPTTATVRWTTDVNSSSLVWYATTSPVTTSGNANISRSAKVLDHKINLSGLTPATTYYVVIGSANAAGTTKSSEVSFTTPAKLDPNAPVISSLAGSSTATAGEETTVTVNASDPNNGSLSYSADWGDSASMMRAMTMEPPFVQTATFTHTYSTAGTYTATFTAENDAGLKASSSLTITVAAAPVDTTAPVISNVTSSAVNTSSATITWTTDESALGEVFYATTTPVDVNSSSTLSSSEDTMGTTHSVTLTGLTAGTTYHYVVESSDSSDNNAKSAELTFTTNS